mmetsp:Transcript_31617/g.102129  ORF Transcript_31617/g.102129 Transcript_31617/m.102129 type:complete len:203 (-) Transcript_31617:129-737(-)
MHRRVGVGRCKHVPVGRADLAEQHRVEGHVAQVHRVRLGLRRVKVVSRPDDGSRPVREQVFRRVAHAVDAPVGTKVRRDRLLHGADVLGNVLGAAEGTETRLPVHLDAVHARGRQIPVHALVQLQEAVGVDGADAKDGRRVPREGGLHLEQAPRRLGHDGARRQVRHAGRGGGDAAPVAAQRVPTVHGRHAVASLELRDELA